MGGADVVPGVSGGTIAFITGIYEELINSIRAINPKSIRLLVHGNFREFWQVINGNFLMTLFAGILLSIKSLASLMTYLIDHYPIQLWAFFWGLIVISSIVVLRQIHQWSVGVVISGLIGIGLAILITSLSPSHTSDGLPMIFLSGILGISAMILPGISGAFILLILGKYKLIVEAVNEVDLLVLVTFLAGCAIGLITFVRVIAWLLKKYHNQAVALLAGFMMGSLNKIWPWKEVIEYRMDRHGQQIPYIDHNILPNRFFELTGQDPLILQAFLFMVIGFLIVVVIEKIALLLKQNTKG